MHQRVAERRRTAKAHSGRPGPRAALAAYLTPGVLAPGAAADIASAPLPAAAGADAGWPGGGAKFMGCAVVQLLDGGTLAVDGTRPLGSQVPASGLLSLGAVALMRLRCSCIRHGLLKAGSGRQRKRCGVLDVR